MKEEEITEQIAHFFRRMQIPQEVAAGISNKLDLARGQQREFKFKQLEELDKEYADLDKMKRTLYWDKNKGSITEEEYVEYRQELVDKISEVEAKRLILKETEDNYEVTAKYLLDLLSRAPELFLSSNIEERRILIKLVFQNLTLDGREVRFRDNKPFYFILNFTDQHAWLPEQDSNLRPND